MSRELPCKNLATAGARCMVTPGPRRMLALAHGGGGKVQHVRQQQQLLRGSSPPPPSPPQLGRLPPRRNGGAGGGARRGAAPKVVCRGARCFSAGGSPPPPSPSQLGRLPPRLPRVRGAAPGAARGEEQRPRWCDEGPAAHAIMPDSRAARAGQWRTRRVRADKGPVRDARGRGSAAGRAEHLIRVQMSRPRRSRHSK